MKKFKEVCDVASATSPTWCSFIVWSVHCCTSNFSSILCAQRARCIFTQFSLLIYFTNCLSCLNCLPLCLINLPSLLMCDLFCLEEFLVWFRFFLVFLLPAVFVPLGSVYGLWFVIWSFAWLYGHDFCLLSKSIWLCICFFCYINTYIAGLKRLCHCCPLDNPVPKRSPLCKHWQTLELPSGQQKKKKS